MSAAAILLLASRPSRLQAIQVLLPSDFAVARRSGFVTCTLSFAAVVAPRHAAGAAAALSCELHVE